MKKLIASLLTISIGLISSQAFADDKATTDLSAELSGGSTVAVLVTGIAIGAVGAGGVWLTVHFMKKGKKTSKNIALPLQDYKDALAEMKTQGLDKSDLEITLGEYGTQAEMAAKLGDGPKIKVLVKDFVSAINSIESNG